MPAAPDYGGSPLRTRSGGLSLAALLLILALLPFQPFLHPRLATAASRQFSAALDDVTGTPLGSTASTPVSTSAPSVTPIDENPGAAHYVVVLVLDAGNPKYTALGRFPHLQALIQHGTVYDQAYVGEMESSTPNVHVTIGTGDLPRQTGFMGFGWVSEQTRKIVDFRTLLADGQIDPVLKALPEPSIAAHLHQVYPDAISLVGSGHKDYASVGLGGGAATYEIYGQMAKGTIHPSFMHTPPPISAAQRKSLTLKLPLPKGAEDTFAFQYAIDVAQRVKPRLLMLNIPETDTWGHWYGPNNSTVFRGLMANFDQGLGRLEAAYQKMGILKDTDFIITADHSMMESRPALGTWKTMFQAGRDVKDPVVRADGEGGGIWLQDPDRAQVVAEKLVTLKPAHVMAIFYRSGVGDSYHYVLASPENWLINAESEKALSDLVDTTAGRNGPDVWVLLRENYTVVSRNVSGVWKGTHGGATWNVQHIPLILSGPGIRSGYRSQFPARAIDMAPTIESLLGLPPIRRDGVALADALIDATPDQRAAQLARFSDLSAMVTAMREQSAADSRSLKGWNPPPRVSPACPASTGTSPSSTCMVDQSTATNQ